MFSYPNVALGIEAEIRMLFTIGLLLNFPGVKYLMFSFEKDQRILFDLSNVSSPEIKSSLEIN